MDVIVEIFDQLVKHDYEKEKAQDTFLKLA